VHAKYWVGKATHHEKFEQKYLSSLILGKKNLNFFVMEWGRNHEKQEKLEKLIQIFIYYNKQKLKYLGVQFFLGGRLPKCSGCTVHLFI
jgi:hypothetical protein